MTRIFALLVYLICCVNVMAQNNNVFPDTMRLKVDNGKVVKLPLTYSDENSKFYCTNEKFVEHDTTFLYREYSYCRDDSTKPFDTYVISECVIPRSHSGYRETLDNISPWRGDDEVPSKILDDFIKQSPNIKRQQLGDFPRVWYFLLKKDGAYYYSIDEPTIIEFTDKILVYYTMEIGPRLFWEFRKLDGGGWTYKTKDFYDKGKRVSILPCSKLKGAYIMTSTVEGGQPEYSLWTNDREIQNFDLITVCSQDVAEGLDYDEIDFNSLR